MPLSIVFSGTVLKNGSDYMVAAESANSERCNRSVLCHFHWDARDVLQSLLEMLTMLWINIRHGIRKTYSFSMAVLLPFTFKILATGLSDRR